MTLREVLAVLEKWLYLRTPMLRWLCWAPPLPTTSRATPCGCCLSARPAGGKTELLQSVAGLKDVHQVATLTEASLLSGTPNARRRTRPAPGPSSHNR